MTAPSAPADWERAALALQLLALDPQGLGGAAVRIGGDPQCVSQAGKAPSDD